jgi:hypothetical protein
MAHPGFIVEFNNPTKYGQSFGSHLRSLNLRAKRLPHKTAWLLKYGEELWKFKKLLARISKAIKVGGSALVISRRTGKALVIAKSKPKKFKRVFV